jgi:3-oxoacyl-[acyl-carrier-protein] synthase-3
VRVKKAVIKGISCQLASQKLTNEQLARECQDWSVEKIFEKTGISERYISASNECASDLGVAAAQKLFATGLCDPRDIDFLLLCTQTPDYLLPASACIMQDRLSLKNSCGALDINLGCSAFIYGLASAKGLIETGLSDNILLITADTGSKLVNPRDRSMRTIISDGAAATLISGSNCAKETIGPFVFGTDGRGANMLIVPAGKCRVPLSSDTAIERDDGQGNFRSSQNFFMDGPEILVFAMTVIPKVVNQLLEKGKLNLEDVDYFVFHQASKFILEQLRKKMKIPEKKFCINLERFGNTGHSTIPMALEIARLQNHIKKDAKVMLAAFGGGLSWAAAIVELSSFY